MRRVSLIDPATAVDPNDPPGFRAKMFRFGRDLGASQTGASLYELPPGEAVCPYHFEHAWEEWLLVLAGRPSVRDPDGVTELAPLDVVFFPPGPEGAHQVLNASDEVARVLMWGTTTDPSATTYPDSDKVGIWTHADDPGLLVPRSAAVGYWEGESR
jgi:uncharacterized cupin superfamily protein